MSAFDAQTTIPSCITAGEAWPWTETPTDYPPASYKLRYVFAGQTPQDGFKQFILEGSESGSSYTFTFPTTVKPGDYQWEKWVIRSSDSLQRKLCNGSIIIQANLAVTPTVTAAAQMLASLNAAIQQLVTTAQNRTVSFNNQSYTKEDLSLLYRERTRLQAEVYKEQQQILGLSGRAGSREVGVQFVPSVGSQFQSWPFLARPGY